MFDKMQPFTAFMSVESSRSYIDDLYSEDLNKCLISITCIKNSVIGSNRQKESVITQGIVPRLIHLLKNKNMKGDVRTEAVVTIGSLAKGTQNHIELLTNSGIVESILEVLDEDLFCENLKLIDACLSCLRTLASQDYYPIHSKFKLHNIQRLLSLVNISRCFKRLSCIATILSSYCKGVTEQHILFSVGAVSILAPLVVHEHPSVQITVTVCLTLMTFNNLNAASELVNATHNKIPIPEYLAAMVSREKPPEIQIEAAKCLTNLHKAGAILAHDAIITFKTLPCLVRLCQLDNIQDHRIVAAETLAYLTECDSQLQEIASISNQLITALLDLLQRPNVPARTAAFRAFASLGANDEEIRKRIIDTKCLMEQIVEGLTDSNKEINLASVRCLHSLSRSVQQLRTTFQDHSVWKPLMTLLAGNGDPSQELLLATSSTLCNLLLEFSPAKEPIIQQGAIQILARLTSSADSALRLNGVWALMNLAFQAEQRVKCQIIGSLGTDQIFKLLADAEPRVLMKTLGLLRNLVSPRAHTDGIMFLHGPQIMQGVMLVLDRSYSAEIKEQALLILANIADGEKAKEHITSNVELLKAIIEYMNHPAANLQESAVFCIGNLTNKGEPGAIERQNQLRDLGVVQMLQQMIGTSDALLFNRVKNTLANFKDT